MFTLKKLLLNNLVTLNKNLTLKIVQKQKNQCSGTGFACNFKKKKCYDNVIDFINKLLQ